MANAEEIARVLRPGGVACLIVPSAGPEHRHPVDCWRFYPDGLRALARHAGLDPVEVFTDWGLGQWQDSFAVLQKPPAPGAGAAPFPRLADLRLAERQYCDPLTPRADATPVHYAKLDQIESRAQRPEAAAAALREGLERFPDNVYLRQRIIGALCAADSPGAAIDHALALLKTPGAASATIRTVDTLARRLPDRERAVFEAALQRLPAGTLAQLAEASFPEKAFALGAGAWASLALRRPEVHDYRVHCGVALLGTARRAQGLAMLAEGVVNRTTVVQQLVDRLGARCYLEIGVERGSNFLQIAAPRRIAVDPALAVPGGVRGLDDAQWIALTSDAFFARRAARELAGGVDVVLVDGLHTHEQSLRDVENSLAHLAPGGVIVMHDCLPQNAAEACRSEAEARRHPEFRNAWTGDVFRTVMHLRATRPDLEVFVLDTDHGVGIVRRGSPLSRPAIDAQLVDRIGFAEFSRRREELLELRPPGFFAQWLAALVPGA